MIGLRLSLWWIGKKIVKCQKADGGILADGEDEAGTLL